MNWGGVKQHYADRSPREWHDPAKVSPAKPADKLTRLLHTRSKAKVAKPGFKRNAHGKPPGHKTKGLDGYRRERMGGVPSPTAHESAKIKAPRSAKVERIATGAVPRVRVRDMSIKRIASKL